MARDMAIAGNGYSRQLSRMIEPAVTGLGYELVGVRYFSEKARALVQVYIDHPEGIDLDDCEQVSHQVSGVLDVANPIQDRYDLEVSSPGLDRPLFEPSHFQRFAGCRVRIKFHAAWNGRKNITGQLLGCQSGHVLVVEDATEQAIEQAVPLDRIASARLVPES